MNMKDGSAWTLLMWTKTESCSAPAELPLHPEHIPSADTKKGAGENSTHELPVNTRYIPTASSFVAGREPHFSSDESPLTWWQPCDDDTEPTLTFGLKQGTYRVTASRVWWKEQGLDYAAGIVPGPFRYLIEGYNGKGWSHAAGQERP